MANAKLPECGLYRAAKALPGHEDRVPAGTLVYFHNHPDSLPSVLPPDHNVHNRWHFHGPAIEFRGFSWAESLQKVPEEGFYTLKKDVALDPTATNMWRKGTLVQLGYTRQADPILFIAQVRARLAENDLWFSERGLKVTREQLVGMLEPVIIYQEPSDGSDGHAPSDTH